MQIRNMNDVPAVPVEMQGANNVTVKVLFGPKEGAPNFAMRIFELAPDGHTPCHNHPFEHEVLILDGTIAVVTPDGPQTLMKGDSLLILPDETHQFKNLSAGDNARFLCLVPVQYQK